jgi:hypothetical protein
VTAKKQTDLVILDFSIAFDTVPHKTILHKSNNYGIDGKVCVSSFLNIGVMFAFLQSDGSSPVVKPSWKM